MPSKHYAIVDASQQPARVVDVVEVMVGIWDEESQSYVDETFHPRPQPHIEAHELPEGSTVAEGDEWAA